jgi:hypothetical protein
MRPIARVLICVLLLVGNLNCSVNVLEIFADKTTNEAIYVESMKLMNAKDYQGALDLIATMTDDYEATRKVVTLKASAYAGLCGFEFLPFVDAMSNMGSTFLFPFLLGAFRSATTTTQMDDCRTAEDLVESIGTLANRTTDENLLLLMISFAKIGVTLSYYADADQDGTVTGGFDVCTAAGARTAGASGGVAIPDSDIREIGSGLTLAMTTLQQIGSEINLGSGSLTALTDVCADLAALPPAGTYDFCSITDPTAFTASHLKAIRSLLKEDSAVGLDSMGCNGDVSVCNCP